MVGLCGVVSPSVDKDELGGIKIVNSNPSRLVHSDIFQKFRVGARIGIPDLSEDEWYKVSGEWYEKLEGCEQQTIHYHEFLRAHWSSLRGMLLARGLVPVPLERAEDYDRHTQLQADLFIYFNGDIYPFGDSFSAYLPSPLKEEDLVYQLNVAKSFYDMRKIEVIDRAETLLQRIGELGVDVAIVGRDLSNYWMANPNLARQKGIVFDKYFGESLRGKEIEFLDSLPVDSFISNRRSKLERTLTLLRGERLTERNPHLVGSWSVDPLKGYFGMFFNGDSGQVRRILSGEQSPNISGTIEDCLGSAVFEGRIIDGRFLFSKSYNSGFFGGGGGPIRDYIHHSGSVKISPGLFESSGSFRSAHKGGRFFITSDPNIGLVKLGLKYDENNKPSQPEYE